MGAGRGAELLSPPAFDHEARLERMRRELDRRKAAGIVLTPGPNLRWLAGLATEPSERLLALVVPVAGAPRLVVPGFERERMAATSGLALEVAEWGDGEDPFRIASGLVSGGAWLLDPLAPFWVADRFRELGAGLGSAGEICRALRWRKDPLEIAVLARAQRLTRETLETVRARLEPGVTEAAAAGWILESFAAAGAPGWALVQFGAGSAVPHGEPGSGALAAECAVLVDLGAVVQGYHADLTRSWWHGGRRPARHVEVAEAVLAAQAAAAALARPGVPAGDLDREARRLLEARGLGRYFTHRLGHGLGLEIHEEPYLIAGSDLRLEAGNVVTLEPGAYLPGEFGVRHEGAFVIEEAGCREL